MAGMAQPRRYLSYLLRAWPSGEGQGLWHASLESPTTGERRLFGNLSELAAFLTSQAMLIDDQAEAQSNPPAPQRRTGVRREP